jgi:hypothetical protein
MRLSLDYNPDPYTLLELGRTFPSGYHHMQAEGPGKNDGYPPN